MDIKGNKKRIYKYISDKRKTREYVSPLQEKTEDQDIENVETQIYIAEKPMISPERSKQNGRENRRTLWL
ncbi:hypothetical protein BTVI_112198 [Pitangus sulphuratus]|nr:hypothetical protein BTVI_112198 [Pitangus sulphuratus]